MQINFKFCNFYPKDSSEDVAIYLILHYGVRINVTLMRLPLFNFTILKSISVMTHNSQEFRTPTSIRGSKIYELICSFCELWLQLLDSVRFKYGTTILIPNEASWTQIQDKSKGEVEICNFWLTKSYTADSTTSN